MWNPWAWVVTAAFASFQTVARSRYSQGATIAILFFSLLLITVPGVLATRQAGLNAKMPARQLVIWDGRLWMMYPRTYHEGGAPGAPKLRGFKQKQPRDWINEGVPLPSLRVEAAWVGGRDSLTRADPRGLGGDIEVLLHQLDLTDGRVRVSLCKCVDPALRLLPVMLAAGLKVGTDTPPPALQARVVVPRR
ncbi:MAG TPA: hypothetical protein VJ547_01015 [Candidatus Thermoplasmatota archaeon]|nr:hypothetical protein [Candidatus Thermoplasmatota archaeon]